MLQHLRDKEGVPEEQQMLDCCHREEGDVALDVAKNTLFQLHIIFGIKIQQKTTNQSLGWCAVSYRTTLRLLCSLYTRQ